MRSSCTILVLYLAISFSAARADVVYSNFGPGNSFETSAFVIAGPNAPFIGSFIRSVAFTPNQDYYLDSVDLVLSNRQDGPKTYDVVIGGEVAGLPGNSLEQAAVSVPDIRALLSATFSHTSVLHANQQYWLWVKPRGVDEGT